MGEINKKKIIEKRPNNHNSSLAGNIKLSLIFRKGEI